MRLLLSAPLEACDFRHTTAIQSLVLTNETLKPLTDPSTRSLAGSRRYPLMRDDP